MKSQLTLKDDNLSSMQNTKPFFVTNQYNTSHDTASKNYRDELSFKQANINFESLKKGDRLNMEQSFSNLHDGYFNKNSECQSEMNKTELKFNNLILVNRLNIDHSDEKKFLFNQ